jgi:transcription elongation factor GreB
MNKAFTREADDDAEDDVPDSAPPLPAGTKNYMTPGGFCTAEGGARPSPLGRHRRPELVATIAWAAVTATVGEAATTSIA